MKLLCLNIIFCLLALSFQNCEYFKAHPKELTVDSESYYPYSEEKHGEKSQKIEISSDNQLENEKNKMNYFDCTNYCKRFGCMIQCLSFENKNILTHYYYENNDKCKKGLMESYFGIIQNQCHYDRSAEGNSFKFVEINGFMLIYNFRTGKFELEKPGNRMVTNVKIEKKHDEAYNLHIAIADNTEELTLTKQNYYYCFNAIVEIYNEYREEESECHDLPHFTNMVNNNNNIAANYFNFPSDTLNNDNNFIDNISHIQWLRLIHINKRIVKLNNSSGSRYDFNFDSHKCYDYFLNLVQSLTCSNINDDYFFLFKKGDKLFQYKFDFSKLEAIEYDLTHKRINHFKLENIVMTETNKVKVNFFKEDYEVDEFELEIIVYKDIYLQNLNKFKDKCEKQFKLETTGEPGIITKIEQGKITYLISEKNQELTLSNFKVTKHEEGGFTYELYDTRSSIRFFLKQDIIENLAETLSHIPENIFYFKKGENEYGKIIIMTGKDYPVEVESFTAKTEIKHKDFVYDKDQSAIRFQENGESYVIYAHKQQQKLLDLSREISYCQSGYKYSAVETWDLNVNELKNSKTYIEPKRKNSFNKIKKDMLEDIFGKDSNKYTILNFFKKEGELNYLVQIISNTIGKDDKFTVMRIWFLFNEASSPDLCKRLSTFLTRTTCSSDFSKLEYYSVNNKIMENKGVIKFEDKTGKKILINGESHNYNHDSLSFEGSGLSAKLIISLDKISPPVEFSIILSTVNCTNLDKIFEIKYSGLYNFSLKRAEDVIYMNINSQGLTREITVDIDKNGSSDTYYSAYKMNKCKELEVSVIDSELKPTELNYLNRIGSSQDNEINFFGCHPKFSTKSEESFLRYYISECPNIDRCYLDINKKNEISYVVNKNNYKTHTITNITEITYAQGVITISGVQEQKPVNLSLKLNIDKNFICENYLKKIINEIKSKRRMRHRN
jgi:hypothetical protein